MLRRDVYSRHESLTLARLWLLLVTLTLRLLSVLRWRRHRALTTLVLLRIRLHVAASLLLTYVYRVSQTVLRYRRRQVRLATAVRADGTRAARGATTTGLATRVFVDLMLLTLLLAVAVVTAGTATPTVAIAQQRVAERPRWTAQMLRELGMARREIVQVRADAVATRVLEDVRVVERKTLRR